MNTPPNDILFKEGYCIGIYESTLDQGPRLRLPRAILKVLQEHNVLQIWRFPDLSGPRMILCPDEHRGSYIESVTQMLSTLADPDMAYRRFLSAGMPVMMNNHGRIPITAVISNHMKVTPDDSVVIVGLGLWYEVWKFDDWLKASDAVNRPKVQG